MKDKRKKSVALKYSPPEDTAPKIIASGYGEVAQKIRDIAKENNIPLYQDEDLAGFLVKLNVGEYIPEELYKILAQIFAWVWEVQNKVAKTE